MSGPTLTTPSAATSMPGNARRKAAFRLLPERQHDRVRLKRFESSRWLRPAVSVELHHFDGEIRPGDFFDAGQPLDSDAFFDRLIRFESVRRHVRAITPIDDERLVCAQTLHRARRIHRRVSRAVDHHPAAETRRFTRL